MALLGGIDVVDIAQNYILADDCLDLEPFAEAVIRAWVEKQEVVAHKARRADWEEGQYSAFMVNENKLLWASEKIELIAKPNLEK